MHGLVRLYKFAILRSVINHNDAYLLILANGQQNNIIIDVVVFVAVVVVVAEDKAEDIY